MHCSTKNLTHRCVQLAVRISWLSSLLARLAQVMPHGSLPLAIAPQRFASRWVRFLVEQCNRERQMFASPRRLVVTEHVCAKNNSVSLLAVTPLACLQT